MHLAPGGRVARQSGSLALGMGRNGSSRATSPLPPEMESMTPQHTTGLRPCPVKGCRQFVSGDLLACKHHWAMVPSDVRKEVWRLYRSAPGTPSHLAMVRKVLEFLGKRAC